jgi:hypothetical protein
MRRPIFTWFPPAPISATCTCGAPITTAGPPGVKPTIIPAGCARCWPRWIERRLEKAVLTGAMAAVVTESSDFDWLLHMPADTPADEETSNS